MAENSKLSTDASDGDSKPTRSTNHDVSTYVNFVNKTRHRIQVLWLNYKGEPVWYMDLVPGESYRQQTYVTHPWMCVECDTGRFEPMEINSHLILYPEQKTITVYWLYN